MSFPDPAPRHYTVRGYIHRSGDRYVAITMQPYLAVEGKSFGEARHKMDVLIKAYLADALVNGEFDQAMARKAPFRNQCVYFLIACLHLMSTSFKPFTNTCCIPQHA